MALALSNPQSSIPNPQSPISNPNDWLPIDEAASLTGLTDRHWRRRAARLASSSLAHTAPPRGGRGKPTWWIHRSADPRLSRYPGSGTREDRARSALLERFPAPHVERAYRKAYWLREWHNRCSRPRGKGETERTLAVAVAAEAKRIEGEGFPISPRTLQVWHAAYNALGADGQIRGVEALVDNYAGPRNADAPPSQEGDGRACANRSPEAVDYFFALYHAQASHSRKTCHKATLRLAAKRGWSWPASYSATARWLREHENRAETCLHRDGRTEYSKRYMQYLPIDHAVLEPGERYVLDHSQADFWCRYKDRVIRPWVTGIIDARSRILVGHHLGPSPHQDAIVAAMRMAFRDWAIPAKVHIDQGKDFTSELITGVTKAERRRLRKELGPDWREILRHQQDVFWQGILGELAIDIAEATPYHPWAKGLIERWFGTMHDQFDKTFATYCGNSSNTKPECVEELRHAASVPTLDSARRRFAEYVSVYHATEHRGLDGLTPLVVWSTATRLRKAVDSELMALLQSRGVYRVGANGVSFRVAAATLTYGATSARLRAYAGRDVFVTLDPDDGSYCCAFTVERGSRRFIDRLACNIPVPANTPVEDLREAIRSLRRRNKGFDQAQREAPKRMRNAAHEVAAMRSEQARELRATGTDDAKPNANVIPVRTGFEAVSIPDRTEAVGVSGQTGETMKRLAAFVHKQEPAKRSGSPWSRLRSFANQGKNHD